MTEISVEDLKDLDEVTRLVVLIELEPLSDKYLQVILPREAFTRVSDAAWAVQPDSAMGEGRKDIICRPMEPVIIKDLESFYSPEYIASLLERKRKGV
jgi:hypothetical protein